MNPRIYEALKTTSIVKYLESKGHFPVKYLSGGKLQYYCPFPDHKETKPSFIVWTDAEYENFRCFGCQRCYNIFHLVSELEGIPYKEAVSKICGEIEFDLKEAIDTDIKFISKKLEDLPTLKLEEILIEVYNICRLYLKSVNHLVKERNYIDGIFKSIDCSIHNYDFENIYHIKKNLQKFRNKLRKRREKVKEFTNDRMDQDSK